MQKESTVNSQPNEAIDEELIDTLIAISVVAKRLAANLRKQNNENGGKCDEQNELTLRHDRQPDQLRRNPGRDRQSFEGILFRNRRSSPGKA